MSKYQVEEVSCPKCGKKSEFTIWTSINTMLDPDMKAKVRNREAFCLKCPHCGKETYVNYGFLYHQMEDRMMIYYVTDEKNYDTAYEMFTGKSDPAILKDMRDSGYLFRIVTSWEELYEKLHIFDLGLDDRVIELAKPFFVQSAKEQKVDVKHIFFNCNEDDEYVFDIFGENGYVGSLLFPTETYHKIQERFLKNAPDIRDDRIDIDAGWVVEILNNRH